MKIAICDDNKTFVEFLEKNLHKYQIEENYDFEIDSYFAVEDLYRAMEENSYKLIFLDIEFPEKSNNGLDLAKKLRYFEKNFNTEIIFVSGSEAYFRDLVSFQPLGFLEKPVVYEKLKDILDLFFLKSKLNKNIFTYKKNSTSFVLGYEDILYFVSSNRKVEVRSLEGRDDFYERLDQLEKTLNPKIFLRVHKSYIVNTNYIKNYSATSLVLSNGESIPVSATYAEDFILFLERKFGGANV
ncbi:MAG: LytTR family DNA-binding domain-containing protein [Bacillota bacterium]|nr:LytTR family DNA-binding domain-containing protein [Bacillota bacterium]